MSVERRASGSSRDMVTAPKTRLVQKQPHLLAYITPAEAALLKENGGTGEMVNGIPAFRKGGGRSDRGRSSSPKSEKKSSPAPKERNDRQPVAKSKPAPAPKERNDRQPVAKPAPAPKERNDRQPVAKPAPAPKPRVTRSITVPAPPPKNDGPSAAEKAAAAAKVKALADAKDLREAKALADSKAKALADATAKSDAAKAAARVQSLADAKERAKEKADAADAKAKADAADAKEKADAADAKAKSDAKAKADAKVAEEKRIKEQLAADAKKAKAALAVEKAPAIAKGKYLPAGSTTDKRGLTMDTTQNPRLDKNGNVVSAEDAKYLNFTDMIDGGGPGRAGPEFQTKRQAIDSPTGGEKTGTVATWIGATPLNSGIQPTGIAGFMNSGGIIGSIMNSVLGPDTRTEEEKAAALLLQQQQMDRDNNRDSDQIRIQPNPVAPEPPPNMTTDPYLSTPISSGMYGNVGQVSAQDLMVGGNQTSQELLNAPRALPTGEIPFSEPTQEEMFARINDPARRASIAGENAANPNYTPPGTLMANNGPADQLASIYGPPGQVDPMYPSRRYPLPSRPPNGVRFWSAC
jgi:chemotaxis protein histidine kinase CheA